MKHFFYILFGGIGAFVIGISLSLFGGSFFSNVSPKISQFKLSDITNLANVVVSKPIDGTSISGIKRTVTYTASEEEGLMTAAMLSLPRTSDAEISSSGYVIKNLINDKVVAEYQSDRLMPIASLTKLVTAVVSKKLINDSTKIKITNEIVSTFGNTAQLKVGETLQAKDLYYPLLMVSSNDAAEALARSHGRQKFIQAMNIFVQSIGAYRTTFKDPSGLSPDNLSTANDMVTIFSWIQKNEPEIIEITKLKTKTIRAHTWTNPTRFLSWSNYLGGKNGYTEEAKQTGVAVFYMGQEKIPHIITILGSRSRDTDILKLLTKIKL